MASDATKIREAIIARLTGQDWLPVTGFRRVARPQLQEDEIPALLVVIADEMETPEDEANCGEPRFMDEVTIGISYCVGYAPPEELDEQLDAATDGIRKRLLQDPTFVRGVDWSKAEDDPDRYPLFEAVTKVRRGRLYPQDGASYFGEGRIEMTFQFRTNYEPDLDDVLEHVVITARPAGAGPGTPPIGLKIDIPTT
ncbi:hypothetical protein SAMN02799622_00845 [Methylobacterium sp. UNC378MF]|nr:hypothetical protein SAMN02799622_00845 [Methylobacterium sp. UNC378MF]